MEKQYLSWEEIKHWSDKLAEKIAEDCPDLTKATIVAVSRGGLVPAQLVAFKLNIRDVRVIKLISYDENNVRGEIKDISTDKLIDGRNVYFIDDLTDSGATIKYIRKKFPLSRICTVFLKNGYLERPDICGCDGKNKDIWLVFPWD